MTRTSVVNATGNLPGDGANFSFTFSPIKIFANSELRVYHTVTATGVETLLVEGTGATQYSVSSITFPGTGTITYPATSTGAIPSTETINIKHVPVQDQQTLLKTQGGYFPKVIAHSLSRVPSKVEVVLRANTATSRLVIVGSVTWTLRQRSTCSCRSNIMAENLSNCCSMTFGK